MASSRASREFRYCHGNPGPYKRCGENLCVPLDEDCPCEAGEYRCLDGHCLEPSLICDGVKNCVKGDDEGMCSTPDEGTPLAVVVGVSVASLVIVIAVAVLILVLLRRRRKSRRQESASEPLQSQTSSSDRSTDVEQLTSDSDGLRLNVKQQQHDDMEEDFSLFSDALCTSTPRPDIRRQVHPNSARHGTIKASMLMDIT